MINDTSGFKHIYLCTGYTDLRRGLDGLIAVVNAGFKLRKDQVDSAMVATKVHYSVGKEVF